MKISYSFATAALCLFGAQGATAFTRPLYGKSPSCLTPLKMTMDSAEAVKAAQEASEKYGTSSPEARMAWELVEEIDAANSKKKATKKAAETLAAKQAAEAEASIAVKAAPVVHIDTADAVFNALEAGKMFGKESPEARLAWDIVEELDAANSRHLSTDIHVQQPQAKVMPKAPEPPSLLDKQNAPTTSEEAIAQALLMSKVYGKSSPEAKAAWDVVEEMDSSTSRHKPGDIHVKQEEKVVAPKKAVPHPSAKAAFKDTSNAIKAALQASKEFGPTSIEARQAWELVEEIDAANAHHKTVGTG